MSADQKAFPVSWDQFHRDCRALSWRLSGKQSGRVETMPWNGIVAVARGGLVPAAIVARELDIRTIETVCISSYNRDDQQSDLNIIKGISADMIATAGSGGAGILVIDDLADTGQTARRVRQMLPEAHIATVYAKPRGAAATDTFVTEVSQDTWIHFPWDLDLAYTAPISG